MNKFSANLLLSLPLLSVVVHAQTAAFEGPMDGRRIADAFSGPCMEIVGKSLAKSLNPVALKDRPINIQSICSCSREKFLADGRLQEKLTPEKDVLLPRMEGTHLRSYVELRFFQTVLACTANDLELSLLATVPEK